MGPEEDFCERDPFGHRHSTQWEADACRLLRETIAQLTEALTDEEGRVDSEILVFLDEMHSEIMTLDDDDEEDSTE